MAKRVSTRRGLKNIENAFGFDQNHWSILVRLTGNLANDRFGEDLYRLLADFAGIAHCAVLTCHLDRLQEQRLSLVGGSITEYWAREMIRQGTSWMVRHNHLFDRHMAEFERGKIAPGPLFRFRPDPAEHPEIAAIYEKSGILEKVYGLGVCNDRVHQLNLFRPVRKGPFSKREIDGLQRLLPLVMNLILAHFQICGGGKQRTHNRKRLITRMRQRRILQFDRLSARETRVCDLIVSGLTTEGIATALGLKVSSIKTYRNRAYRKLGISSNSQLYAMIINRMFDDSADTRAEA